MKTHARSENRKIVRKLCDSREGEGKAASSSAGEIGSRVFPFRTPPTMPSVGTRRSTRVFVPKAVAKQRGDGDSARVLRSGKRLTLSNPIGKKAADGEQDEWLRVFGNSGDAVVGRWWRGERENGGFRTGDGRRDLVVRESDADAADEFPKVIQRRYSGDPLDEKFFGIAYRRKRKRLSLDRIGPDRKYGVVFARKRNRKKPKTTPQIEEVQRETPTIRDRMHEDDSRRTGIKESELRLTETVRNFAEKVGISGCDLWTGLGGSMVLAVLVESSYGHSSHRFAHLLIPIMSWMRWATVRLWDLAAFILAESITSVFSLNGVHFLPVRHQENNTLLKNSISGCGFCKIYGAREFVPLLSVDFCALPSYFKNLHATIVLNSQYLPTVLTRNLMRLHENLPLVDPCEEFEYDHDVPVETGFFGAGATVSETPALKWNELHSVLEAPMSVTQKPVILSGSKSQKHQRKRSSLRSFRARNGSLIDSHNGTLSSDQNIIGVSLAGKTCSLRVKPLESCLTDLFYGTEESDISTPPRSRSKKRKSTRKSPVDRMKELKPALAEIRQNVDSVRCNANILVNIADRCWREEGAEVMVEMSGSKEWCLMVKRVGTIRFLYKPQDLRPCAVNRYTHAYIWPAEEGWKLEFSERWDWLVFKELHMECRERNRQDVSVRIIPVPGVREVSGYEDNAAPSFVRPDIYIHMINDEVGRALASEMACYDMDSADEEWLNHLNSSSLNAENSSSNHLLEENFERIIFAWEKDAYTRPDSASDRESALDLCQGLGQRDMLVAVYDYWLKKRSKKRTPLVKVFQGPPSRRAQLIHKPFLRKKRSFKRQRSQAGRGKMGFICRATADKLEAIEKEDLRRVQEAESAASRAAKAAIHLRTRAQVFMAHADLAVYRSAMALTIAEAVAISSSECPADHHSSSIVFD